jgi:hypothetical protein
LTLVFLSSRYFACTAFVASPTAPCLSALRGG